MNLQILLSSKDQFLLEQNGDDDGDENLINRRFSQKMLSLILQPKSSI